MPQLSAAKPRPQLFDTGLRSTQLVVEAVKGRVVDPPEGTSIDAPEGLTDKVLARFERGSRDRLAAAEQERAQRKLAGPH